MGRYHGRRKRGFRAQAAVGNQLTMDGDLLSVSDEGEWWPGRITAKRATRNCLTTDRERDVNSSAMNL